eukprot:12923852-Prorocentrum_lima.AAC.1
MAGLVSPCERPVRGGYGMKRPRGLVSVCVGVSVVPWSGRPRRVCLGGELGRQCMTQLLGLRIVPARCVVASG